GHTVEAYARCKQIVAQYPHDVAAWYQLAEIEFHYYPWLGRSFRDSRAAFEEVASLAPQDAGAPLHLARLAAFENRRGDFDSLMHVHDSLSIGARDPETALFAAVVQGHASARDSIIESLKTAGADTVVGAAWRIAQY